MTDSERNQAVIYADLMAQGKYLFYLSLFITAAALYGLLICGLAEGANWRWFLWFTLIALNGLLVIYYSMRVYFDAVILHRLGNTTSFDLNHLDDALLKLKLIPTSKTGRPLQERINGCKALFKMQLITIASQFMLTLISGFVVLI